MDEQIKREGRGRSRKRLTRAERALLNKKEDKQPTEEVNERKKQEAQAAVMSEAKVTEAKVTEAKVTEAKVTEAKVTAAKVTEAKVTEAKATEAKVTEAKVAEAKVTEAKVTEPQGEKAQAAETETKEKKESVKEPKQEPKKESKKESKKELKKQEKATANKAKNEKVQVAGTETKGKKESVKEPKQEPKKESKKELKKQEKATANKAKNEKAQVAGTETKGKKESVKESKKESKKEPKKELKKQEKPSANKTKEKKTQKATAGAEKVKSKKTQTTVTNENKRKKEPKKQELAAAKPMEPISLKKEGRYKQSITLIGVGVCVVLIALSYLLFHATPVFTEKTVELGETLSADIRDYVKTNSLFLYEGSVDLSAVDSDTEGTYEVRSKVLFHEYVHQITIADTTAPVIAPKEDRVYLEAGKTYEASELVKAEDASSELTYQITCEEEGVTLSEKKDQITFAEFGSYALKLLVKDRAGNESETELTVVVDEAPILIGVRNRIIKEGEEFDLKKGVIALDGQDGLLTDQIEIEDSGFDYKKADKYEIRYSVTDRCGLTAKADAVIEVLDAETYVKRLAAATLDADAQEEIKLTDAQLRMLCELDYFAYEPLEKADKEEAVAMVMPTQLDIQVQKDAEGTLSYAGNGTVYKVTPEFVYLLTTADVFAGKEDKTITFVNHESGAFTSDAVSVVTSDTEDLALAAVATKEIRTEVLLAMRQICADSAIYEELSVGDTLIACSNAGSAKTLTVETIKRAPLIEGITIPWSDVLETDGYPSGAKRGTIVIDRKGNLVGIASSYTTFHDTGRTIGRHTRIDQAEQLVEQLDSELMQ